MIVIETFVNFDGRELKKTYSNNKVKIHKIGTNEIYNEAIDVLDSNFEYVETNKSIDEVIIEENV